VITWPVFLAADLSSLALFIALTYLIPIINPAKRAYVINVCVRIKSGPQNELLLFSKTFSNLSEILGMLTMKQINKQ